MEKGISRRVFLERLGTGAMAGAAGLSQFSRQTAMAQSNPDAAWPNLNSGKAASYTRPSLPANPNILVILVDQMRQPLWLNSSQMTTLNQSILPNIFGRIRDESYVFQQYFTAATACTPSRATLLTGLYSPQSAVYATEAGATAPPLNPAFPTWGSALQALNPSYKNNVWWFGKWHLSDFAGGSSSPLAAYGFNTRTYPGGASGNASPNGAPNQGTNGGTMQSGPYQGKVFASDAQITGDFIAWLRTQTASSWCATLSLINPHDIAFAPSWLQSSPFPPTNGTGAPIYFQPPTGTPPSLYTAPPAPWNYENLQSTPNKPAAQYSFQNRIDQMCGPVTNWTTFLNQYYWLQGYVDRQIGLALNALYSSPFANNTVVVFASDHGDYAGSHGLHDKGGAVYDESLRVPLYVHFPGQTSCTVMNQMCSSVDFFGLICDLGTNGAGQWMQAYPDQSRRQSIWSFLNNNSSETRVAPSPVGLPYIFHTYDEAKASENGTPAPQQGKSHVVCLRTKFDSTAGAIGAKLAFYSSWAPCATIPDGTQPDPEFYDYNPQTTANRAELGNDYYSSNSTTQNKIAQYTQVLGTWSPTATGLIASELNAPLQGLGTDGQPLSQAQTNSRRWYFNYVDGTGYCPA